jgi:hypothetical protein
MRAFALALAAAALTACSSTYHPEYHPVTVSNVSQALAYPVSVGNVGTGASAESRTPVYVMLAPPPAPAQALPPPAPPPPGMFDPQ